MGYHEKKERYSRLYSNGLGRWVRVNFKRKNFRHKFHGKIISIKEASLKILTNDEQVITIGFRTINNSTYLDQGLKIKASLYYGAHKPKSKNHGRR
jgi:hypothetical protein